MEKMKNFVRNHPYIAVLIGYLLLMRFVASFIGGVIVLHILLVIAVGVLYSVRNRVDFKIHFDGTDLKHIAIIVVWTVIGRYLMPAGTPTIALNIIVTTIMMLDSFLAFRKDESKRNRVWAIIWCLLLLISFI